MECLNIAETCRLCLQTSNGFNVLDEAIQLKLNSFLIYPNLMISDEPVICEACLDNITHCSDFIANCLPNESCITPHLECNDNNLKLKQEIDENEIEEKFTPNLRVDTGIQCNFCKQIGGAVTALDQSDIEILQVHLPGLELVLMAPPSACTSCRNSLIRFAHFVKTCLQCENKIFEYCKVEEVDCKGQVDLSKVLSFIPKNTLESELATVKLEKNDVDCTPNSELKEEFNIKLECEEGLKTDPLEADVASEETPGTQQTYKCELCPYTSMKRHRIKRHSIAHLNLSEMDTFSCDHCPFKSKYKNSLIKHIRTHTNSKEKPVFKCEACDFNATTKRYLEKHLETHGMVTKPHKCTDCSFETKYLRNLQAHVQLHKDPKKSTTYACDECQFVTLYKTLAKKHKLSHMPQGECITVKTEKPKKTETVFKCYVCDFEGDTRGKLREHVKMHEPVLESDDYKCKFCTYTTNERVCLRKHVKRHKEVSEKKKHWCAVCNFETRHVNSLRAHMLQHDSSPTPRYKCPDCDFRTRHTNNLRKHTLIHKSADEVTMFACDECGFQSKRKSTLRTHMLKHRSMDEVKVHQCPSCDYKSKRKDVLKQHQKTHLSLDEIVSYKCEYCAHRTKRKEHMTLHLLKHKKKSEVKTFRCDSCGFHTKYKQGIQKHRCGGNKSVVQ